MKTKKKVSVVIAALLAALLVAIIVLTIFTFVGGGSPEITLSLSERTVLTGDSFDIRVLNASELKEEVQWMSDDTSVATVDGKGKVRAVGAGEATITAYTGKEPGENAATCEVSVVGWTVTDESGTRINTPIKIDRNAEPQKINLKLTDNSTISSWASSDANSLSVTKNGNNGAELKANWSEGDVTITATTSSKLSVKLDAQLTDTVEYRRVLGTTSDGGTWSYSYNSAGFREGNTGEFRGDVRGVNSADGEYADTVTFEYWGGNFNWEPRDVLLTYTDKNNNGSYGGAYVDVYMDIESSVTGPLTLYSGESTYGIWLNEGMNEDVYACLPNTHSFRIWFGNSNHTEENFQEAKVAISNVRFDNATNDKKTLAAPDFSTEEVEGGIAVTIEDGDKRIPNGVDHYVVALKRVDGEDEKVHLTQQFFHESGVLDTVVIGPRDKGTYEVEVMAVGAYGYNDTAWAEEVGVSYTIEHNEVKYDIAEGGGATALNSNRWVYYIVDGGSVDSATYEETEDNTGTVTLKSVYLGWAGYSTELFRNYDEIDVGKTVLIKMNINVTADKTEEFVGHITVSGDKEGGVRTLHNGDNYVEIYRTQEASDPTISMMFGYWTTNDNGLTDFPTDNELTFTFSDISVEVVEGALSKQPLSAPTATLAPIQGSKDKTLTVTDIPEAEQKYIDGYEVQYVNQDNVLAKSYVVKNGGVVTESMVPTGTYTVKARTLCSGNVRSYTDSAWAMVESGYAIENDNITYFIPFGGGGDSPNALSDINTWYLWYSKEYTWSYPSGYATVTIGDGDNEDGTTGATFANGTVTIPYTTDEHCDWGVQLYYKNTSLNSGTQYAISMNIDAAASVDITINDNKFSLVAGSNDIEVYYQEGGDNDFSFSMQVAVDADVATENTLTLSDIQWRVRPYVKLDPPSIDDIDADGKITFSGNEDKGKNAISGYEVTFRNDAGDIVARMENVQSGDTLDLKAVPGGTYNVKARAMANKGFDNSEEGNAYSYTVSKTGLQYTITEEQDGADDAQYGFGAGAARENVGLWGVWAGPGDWTNWTSVCTIYSAEYDNGTITVSFKLEGMNGGNQWGLQFNYVNPAGGGTYSFDIVSTADLDVQVVSGNTDPIHLNANESKQLTGTGNGSTNSEFYMQVNVADGETIEATITISNVTWH